MAAVNGFDRTNNRRIDDEAAIVFAVSFYRAVGFGRAVKEAFELGEAALLLVGIPEEKTPELLSLPGIYAARLCLIAPPAEEPATKVPVGSVGVQARLALVRELRGLAPADWVTLVAVIPGAGSQVSRQGAVAEQVAELVRWAESPTGPGLLAVEEAFKELLRP